MKKIRILFIVFFAGLLLDCWLIVVNYEAMAETVFLGARQ